MQEWQYISAEDPIAAVAVCWMHSVSYYLTLLSHYDFDGFAVWTGKSAFLKLECGNCSVLLVNELSTTHGGHDTRTSNGVGLVRVHKIAEWFEV